jgi:hypothetical protein
VSARVSNAGTRGSVGTAVGRASLSLAIFAAVFIAFLFAPLLALGGAFLVYLVMHSRSQERGHDRQGPAAAPTFGSGAGTQAGTGEAAA